jgi:MFS family permease
MEPETTKTNQRLDETENKKNDTDNAIDNLIIDTAPPPPPPPPSPHIVYIVAGCAALNTCNVGFDIGVNSPARILLQEDLQWEDWELEIFMGLLNFFALFGALTSSRIVRRYGMKVAFCISSLLFLVGLILMVSSSSTRSSTSSSGGGSNTSFDDGRRRHRGEVAPILVGRALVGLGVGFGFAVTPQYIAKIFPKCHRGAIVSWSEIGCNIGILLGFGTGFWFRNLPIEAGWRWMFGTGCILPVVMLALIWHGVLEESSRWLVTKGRYEESLEVLRRFNPPTRTENKYCDDEFDADVRRIVLKDIQQDMEQERQVMMAQDNSSSEAATGFGWLLQKKSPAVRKMLAIAFGVAISHEICGINAIQIDALRTWRCT